MPEVTVLTTVKNGSRYLAETIDSIRGQTFKDWEYILVDNASTDQTAVIIREYALKDPRIRYFKRTKDVGPYVAANQGLGEAKGNYIVRTDADDISLPDRIMHQVDFLKANPSIRACVTFGRMIREDSSLTGECFEYPQLSGTLKWFLCLRCPLIHSSTCIDKEAMLEIGGYKEIPASADYQFFVELSRKDWLAVLPENLVYFRQHRGRLSLKIENKQKAWVNRIIKDHIRELTGETWTLEDTQALYKVGLGESLPISKGLRVLRDWHRLWKSDCDLDNTERDELTKIYVATKKRFLKKNARSQSIPFLLNSYHYWLPRI